MSTNPYSAPNTPIYQNHSKGDPKRMKDMLFSFEGRITRSQWWAGTGIALGSIFAAALISGLLGESLGAGALIIVGLVYIPVLWISIAIATKRMHDHDKSGWYQLLSLIPFVGIYIFVLCGCMRGTVGPNSYGNDPV